MRVDPEEEDWARLINSVIPSQNGWSLIYLNKKRLPHKSHDTISNHLTLIGLRKLNHNEIIIKDIKGAKMVKSKIYKGKEN